MTVKKIVDRSRLYFELINSNLPLKQTHYEKQFPYISATYGTYFTNQ
jgi:hypothetical protein